MENWAYCLLGILVGIIFILDGWRSTEDPSLGKSPKIRGLTFVLGAGLIPMVQVIATDNKDALSLFALSFVATTLLLIFILGWYAFKVASDHFFEKKVGQIWPYVMVALQEGIPKFNEKMENLRWPAIVGHRDEIHDFFMGCYKGLVSETSENEISKFLESVDGSVEKFLRIILERKPKLEKFRASIYLLDSQGTKLRFLTGVSPVNMSHSGQPLTKAKSLAGFALEQEAPVWGGNRERRFEERQIKARYRSVLSFNVDDHLVVNIDCAEDKDAFGDQTLVEKIVKNLAFFLNDLKNAMKIKTEDLQQYIDETEKK